MDCKKWFFERIATCVRVTLFLQKVAKGMKGDDVFTGCNGGNRGRSINREEDRKDRRIRMKVEG